MTWTLRKMRLWREAWVEGELGVQPGRRRAAAQAESRVIRDA
jgi:hypothetical protein